MKREIRYWLEMGKEQKVGKLQSPLFTQKHCLCPLLLHHPETAGFIHHSPLTIHLLVQRPVLIGQQNSEDKDHKCKDFHFHCKAFMV